MRSFLRLSPTLFLIGCAAAPGVDVDAETAAVRARSEALANAEAAKDANTAITFWADDAIVQAAGGPQLQGREALLKAYEDFFKALKSFKSTTTQVNVAASGDLAWEYGTNELVFAGANGDIPDKGKYLVVWKKVNNEWSVAGLSFTTDSPPQPPAQ